MTIIDCISDCHGHYPELEGGDLLIVAGDFTARDEPVEYLKFNQWLREQNYKKKILIAGNHDNCVQNGITVLADINSDKKLIVNPLFAPDVEYLCDSGTHKDNIMTQETIEFIKALSDKELKKQLIDAELMLKNSFEKKEYKWVIFFQDLLKLISCQVVERKLYGTRNKYRVKSYLKLSFTDSI